jgi:replicative DNA helicase
MAAAIENTEAERQVLGAMLTSAPAVERVLDGAGLTQDAYYSGKHQTIHAAIVTVRENGGTVDELTVAAELEKAGTLDQAGGRNYLAELAGSVAAPGNAKEHAELILEKAAQRQLVALGHGLVEAGEEGSLNGTLDDAAEALDRIRLGSHQGDLKATNAADVEMRHVEFLDAAGMIPKGSLTGLLGVAGVGKTTYTLGLAAQVTRGKLPGLDGPANVLVSSAEDDLPAVLTPRLVAAGADLARVWFLEDLTVPDDVSRLEQMARRHQVALIVVDPITAHYSQKVKGNEVASVRNALRPLAKAANDLNAAVLAVVHPNKGNDRGAMAAISGSHGFGDMVRSVIVFGHDPGDPEGESGPRRVIASRKMNVGPKPASIAAELRAVEVPIEGKKAAVPRLEVTGQSDVAADELVAWQSPDERSDREAAQEWLQAAVANGPRKASDLLEEAGKEGHAERTLRRAKKDLKLASNKQPDGWYWQMPGGHDGE